MIILFALASLFGFLIAAGFLVWIAILIAYFVSKVMDFITWANRKVRGDEESKV